MFRRQQAEGFFTLIVLLTVIALAFGAINKFPSKTDDIVNSDSNNDINGGESDDITSPPSDDEPSDTETPKCNHIDSNNNGLCDICGEYLYENENPPDEPQNDGLEYSYSYVEGGLIAHYFNSLLDATDVSVESLYPSFDENKIYTPLHINVRSGSVSGVRLNLDSSVDVNNLYLSVTDSEGNAILGTWTIKTDYAYFNVNPDVSVSDIYIYATCTSSEGQTYTNVPLAVDKTDSNNDGKADKYAIGVMVIK